MKLSDDVMRQINDAYIKADYERVLDIWHKATDPQPPSQQQSSSSDDGSSSSKISRADLDGMSAEDISAAWRAGRVDGVGSN